MRTAILILLLTTSGAAHGQPAAAGDNREEAKRLKDLGALAFDRGEHQMALELFTRAFAVYPSPRLRFNLGMALTSVGRYGEAIDEFERFLAEAADAPADAREHAQQRLTALEGRVARVTVTIPPGAALLVDGRPVTVTISRPIRLLPGEHELRAKLEGHAPATLALVVAAGEQRTVTLELPPLSAVGGTAPVAAEGTPRRGIARPLAIVMAGIVVVGGGALAVGLGVGLRRRPTPSALGPFDVTFP